MFPMIAYSASRPLDLLSWRGSVAPRALVWALPCAGLAFLYHWWLHTYLGLDTDLDLSPAEYTALTLFMTVLGWLVVFRAKLSYDRYWEGLTHVERACGVWLNGCSNLVAFCSADPKRQDEVEDFQYMLSRLMSLLFCYSMCDISGRGRDSFPHLELAGLDQTGLEYLEGTSSKNHVALQWVQRLGLLACTGLV